MLHLYTVVRLYPYYIVYHIDLKVSDIIFVMFVYYIYDCCVYYVFYDCLMFRLSKNYIL